MDVTSLYTNIPQKEGIEIVRKAYEDFYKDNHPIPIHYLREMPRLLYQREFFPVQWKTPATNPWYCNGHKDSSFFCQYFHGSY